MDDLTEKQKAFCNEYVIDFCGSQAAIRAGYSKKTATEQSSRLLTIVKVQEYLKQLQNELANKHSITKDRVLKEMERLAFYDIRKAFDSNDCLKNVNAMDYETATAITGIEIDEIITPRKKITIRTKKVRFVNKVPALESIARMLGYNEPDKINHGFAFNDLSDEGLDLIIAKLQKTIV